MPSTSRAGRHLASSSLRLLQLSLLPHRKLPTMTSYIPVPSFKLNSGASIPAVGLGQSSQADVSSRRLTWVLTQEPGSLPLEKLPRPSRTLSSPVTGTLTACVLFPPV